MHPDRNRGVRTLPAGDVAFKGSSDPESTLGLQAMLRL